MFRPVAIVVLLVAAGVCGVWIVAARLSRKGTGRKGTGSFSSFEKVPVPFRRTRRLLDALILVALIVSFAALAVTALVPRVVFGEDPLGWWLMTHVTFGGVFSVALMLAVVRWASAAGLASPGTSEIRNPKSEIGLSGWDKAFFWFGALGGLTAMVSILLGMTEWFGPEGIGVLAEVHRWSGLILTALATVYAARRLRP